MSDNKKTGSYEAIYTIYADGFCVAFSLSAGNIEKAVTPNMEDKSPMSHFCWGADLGGSIDMSGHDMSTIDIGANFGYKNDYLRLLGIGASLNMMVSNSNRSFPIYGIVRTNFMNRPSLCFLMLGLGYHLTTLKTMSVRLVCSYLEVLDSTSL